MKIENADLFIVASYGKIIPKDLLNIPKYGAINVHPSLLPKYRGASPIQAAILNGDKEAGVTIMLMDEEMDHGPIVVNSKFKIQSSKLTYIELEQELADLGANLLIETIPDWVAGKIKPEEQNHDEAVYTKKVAKEDGHINWHEPAEVIERKIRAYLPNPGTFTFYKTSARTLRLKIIAAEVTPRPSEIADGEVFRTAKSFAVGTSDGALEIIKIQPDGKDEMPAAAFLNGHQKIIGALLS